MEGRQQGSGSYSVLRFVRAPNDPGRVPLMFNPEPSLVAKGSAPPEGELAYNALTPLR